MATLLLSGGPLDGRRVRISAEVVVGRSEGELQLDDPSVSRLHARLIPAGDYVEVEDLGSTNGTWVNGSRVTGRVRMGIDEQLQIGSTLISIEREAPTPLPSPSLTPPVPFGASEGTRGRRGRIASRPALPTVLAIGTILLTAVALLLYFLIRA